MTITEAKFAGSCTRVSQKPSRRLPEFAFIGRSNVGKSSRINMWCGNGYLAQTSSNPAMTTMVDPYSGQAGKVEILYYIQKYINL